MMVMDTLSPPNAGAGLLRPVGAAVYDGLLLAAILMIVTFVVLRLSGFDPMTQQATLAIAIVHRVLLVSTVVFYFGYAWTRRGQTLGMKAWRIKLVGPIGTSVSWPRALRRLLIAMPVWLCALGGVLMSMPAKHGLLAVGGLLPLAFSSLLLYSPLRRTLPDLVSGTRFVRD
jgi:uncharacterized RDD family membrane protein YckC